MDLEKMGVNTIMRIQIEIAQQVRVPVQHNEV
jgi:hypothetical protein